MSHTSTTGASCRSRCTQWSPTIRIRVTHAAGGSHPSKSPAWRRPFGMSHRRIVFTGYSSVFRVVAAGKTLHRGKISGRSAKEAHVVPAKQRHTHTCNIHLRDPKRRSAAEQNKRPHDMKRCQKCRELGRICVPSMYYSA